MSDHECDITVVVGAVVAFALPLTLLIPDFSLWDVVPKIRVTRFHIIDFDVTWPLLNAGIISLLVLFFCLFLEIRKRKLDDMVENVLTVSQATDVTMDVEKLRQTTAIKAYVELLDASVDHYEHLVLLRDDLRRRERLKKPHPAPRPPAVEVSASEI